MKITFLGAGVFGEALAKIARYNGHEIKFYDPIKYPEIELSSAVSGADIIIYTAPSDKHAEILPFLAKDVPLVCASKGFLSKQPFSNFSNFSALGGAAFANQISEDAKISFTVSSELLEHIFSTETIKVEYTADTLGIMLCGALKNIYAIGAGMFGDKKESEQNSVDGKSNFDQSYLIPYFTSVANEMRDILKANGADENTLKLSCGLPDLVLSSSPDSRNFRFGEAIKYERKKEDTTIEGLSVINDIKEYSDFVIPSSANILMDIIEKVRSYK